MKTETKGYKVKLVYKTEQHLIVDAESHLEAIEKAKKRLEERFQFRDMTILKTEAEVYCK